MMFISIFLRYAYRVDVLGEYNMRIKTNIEKKITVPKCPGDDYFEIKAKIDSIETSTDVNSTLVMNEPLKIITILTIVIFISFIYYLPLPTLMYLCISIVVWKGSLSLC